MANLIAADTASSQPDIPPSVIKSAGRALQILEFFDSVQREASVSEISRALHYPQSSTSVLLRSLVSMGYLQHDRYRRSYFPTRRVSLLGNWVDPALVQQGTLLSQADELAMATRQTIVIATLNGLSAQYIYVRRPPTDDALSGTAAAIGSLRPVAATAVGKALLSTMDDNNMSKLVRRINAERNEETQAIGIPEFLAELKLGRKRGYFYGAGAADGSMAIAAILRRDRQLLAIGIEADQDSLKEGLASSAALLRNLVVSVRPDRVAVPLREHEKPIELNSPAFIPTGDTSPAPAYATENVRVRTAFARSA